MPGDSVGIKAQGTRIILGISADSESSRTWEPKDSLLFFAFVSVLPPPWTLLHTSPAHIAAKALRLPRCVLGGTPFRRSPDPRGRKKKWRRKKGWEKRRRKKEEREGGGKREGKGGRTGGGGGGEKEEKSFSCWNAEHQLLKRFIGQRTCNSTLILTSQKRKGHLLSLF